MRAIAAAALAAAVALSGCGNGSTPSGKSVGVACSAGPECAAGLVCFQGACAASYPAAASCAVPGSARIVRGDPVAAVEPAPGACVAAARDTVPATTAATPGRPIPTGAFVDLGEHAVGTQLTVDVPAGTSSLTIVSQDVGASTARDITFQGFRLPNTVVPTDVVAPGVGPFYSDTATLPTDARGYDDVTNVLAYYAGFTAVAGALTIPNTSRSLDLVRSAGQVPPGTWALTVNDWAQECLSTPSCQVPLGVTPGTYRLAAYARPGPVASTGTLDVEVYLATDPGGALPNAAAAVADPATARWVSKLSEFFGHAGICLGTVTFRDIPDWARTRYAPAGQVDISGAGPGPNGTPPSQTPSGCDDLSQLFTVAVAPSRAVHLFLAEDLVDASTANGPLTVLGIDGSIPGPSGVPGTVNGGAILGTFGIFGRERVPGACSRPSSAGFDCGTDLLAYVAAHEAGHWLGLYHTTEAPGTSFDPLADTGRCPCAQCAPPGERAACAERGGGSSPTLVDASSCDGPFSPIAEIAGRALPGAGCSGAQNLMFWQFDPGVAAGQLSPQQGEVMRLNPAVR